MENDGETRSRKLTSSAPLLIADVEEYAHKYHALRILFQAEWAGDLGSSWSLNTPKRESDAATVERTVVVHFPYWAIPP